MRKEITRHERYRSSGNDDSQRAVLINKQAVSITVVIFAENGNPSKSQKCNPKKTCEQPPPTQKETKYKSHKQHLSSSGTMNKTKLCLFLREVLLPCAVILKVSVVLGRCSVGSCYCRCQTFEQEGWL